MHTPTKETTLRIDIDQRTRDTNKKHWEEQLTEAFSVIEKSDVSQFKYLVIHQEGYEHYENTHSSINSISVNIPETISRLVAVEHITICACIEELSAEISQLVNLKVLDLTGCYNLLSISESIREMPNLKIKIGDVLSEASDVVFIALPGIGIIHSVFSAISSHNTEQLFIHQISPQPQPLICRHPEPEGFELPNEMKELKKLKVLSLRGNLSSIPVWIENLNELRSVELGYCFKLTSLPESVGNLTQLTSLNLSYCTNLASLPESIGNLHNLIYLNLSYCCSVVSLPESIGDLRNLTSLNLSYCSNLRSLPNTIGKLTNLTSLGLLSTPYIESLPESIGNLNKLTSLNLSWHIKLAVLPESLGNLHELTSLDLSYCCTLQSLPDSIWNLSNLTSLNLSYCSNLKSISERIGHLHELTSLDLSQCYNLKSFPPALRNLRKLTQLNLKHFFFTSVPSEIQYLKQITSLDLSGCSNLLSLPKSIGNLSNITSLDLSGCSNLKSLPNSIGQLSQLTSLNLSGCSNLQSLPESIGCLSQLTSLDLGQCGNLRTFPSSMHTLTQLHTLNLQNSLFVKVPSWVECLKEIHSLNLSSCQHLVSLPESIGNLAELTSLDLSRCSNLVSLPESIGNLHKLISLDLRWSNNIECLSNSICQLTHLIHPLHLCGLFEIPLDIDWRYFSKGITLMEYLRYMMKMKRYSSIVCGLSLYLERYSNAEGKLRVGFVFELCGRVDGGGMDMVKVLCRWLTGRMIENSGRSVDMDRNALSENDIRDYGIGILSLLFATICGMKMKREMRKDVRRWREMVDVLSEEDVMETLLLMICIPSEGRDDYYDGTVTPSKSSIWGMVGLGDGIVGGCHFDLFGEETKINDQKCVVIRNLPSGYITNHYGGDELLDMIRQQGLQIIKVKQPEMRSYMVCVISVLKIWMDSEESASTVEERMNGKLFRGRYLCVKRRG